MKARLRELLESGEYLPYAYSYPHKTAYRPLEPAVDLPTLWLHEDRRALFLYVHVPFCEQRCGFCNLFTQVQPGPGLELRYIEALERHDALAGSCLTVARLARCHPWCEGGLDPVPHTRPRLFTSLLSTARPAPATDGPDSPEFPSRPLP